jgi:Mce-associated membrane protein
MEGDAGTSRLNPTTDADADSAPQDPAAAADDDTVVEDKTVVDDQSAADEASPDEPDDGTGGGGTDATAAQDSEAGTDDPAAEDPALENATVGAGQQAERRPTRLGRGCLTAVCAVLVLLAVGAVAGGYLAWRANERAAEIARADAAALAAAKDCVAATQAPDTAAMTAAQSKILECSTGEFGVQAGMYSSVLAEAYQAANATVVVDDLRAAVERHNDDGSINVLVAMRVKISNVEATDNQVGYRLRATMALDEGQYRIANLDQVTS